jgi:hypothetical protein
MLLPRPYPDEIIGSTLMRGCRQLGIPQKRMAPLLRGSAGTTSQFLPSCTSVIAESIGLPMHEVLYGHTVFPYVTAFMLRETVAALERKFLRCSAHVKSSFAALQSRASVPFFRVCVQCISEDFHLYGESYWHRSHMLPGVHVCLKHKTQLWETDLRASTSFKTTLPHEAKRTRYKSTVPLGVLIEVAKSSVEILNHDHSWPKISNLRKMALKKNYCISVDEIPSLKIVTDVMRFYGGLFLKEVRCNYSAHQKSPWPTLILRESMQEFAPIKFLLMGIYLKSCAGYDSAFTRESMGYRMPGPQTDYPRIERRAISVVQKRLKQLAKARQRTTVAELLTYAGVWSKYRHNRAHFPELKALVQQFRTSEQSERQVGKRLRWRKKRSKKQTG